MNELNAPDETLIRQTAIAWWNALNPKERFEALRRAEEITGCPAYSADETYRALKKADSSL